MSTLPWRIIGDFNDGGILLVTKALQISQFEFSLLFLTQASVCCPVTHALDTKLDGGDNYMLIRPFDKSEFKDALMEMDDDKAPGPDNFNLGFFKRNRTNYGDEIFDTCFGWL